MSIDADGARSDVLQSLTEALAGPLAGGARTDYLPVSAAGEVDVEAGLWEPLLLVAPAADVQAAALVVTARLGTTVLPVVTFSPWTEMGAFMPLYRPAVGTARVTTTAERLVLSVSEGATVLPAAQVANRVRVQLLCGSFGRLYYLMQAETIRLRRLARQIDRARLLGTAEGAMLDALGRELAVPRFSERLAVQAGDVITQAQPEPDAQYRRRLALYRPWSLPTRAHVEQTLNAMRPGAARTFTIVEEDNPLCSALRLVSTATDATTARTQRHHYQHWLRDTVLCDPTVAVPATRHMPGARRTAEEQLRLRLRGWLDFAGTSRSMAPALARSLDRAGAMATALGLSTRLNIHRAQDDDAGSRWELGLALEVDRPAQSVVDDLCTRALAVNLAQIADPMQRGLIARLRDRLQAGGAAARRAETWFSVAGMRTAHALAPTRLMLSHFSTQGLVIEGAADLSRAAAADAPFTTTMLSENDATTHAALAQALAGGSTGWGAGAPPWTRVADASLATTVPTLTAPPAALSDRLRVIGLPTSFDVDSFRRTLVQYPEGLYAILRLDAAFATPLAAGQDAAWNRLGSLIQQLARSGAAAAALMSLPGTALALVVSSIALPVLATNLASRRTAGFVWRALPVNDITCELRGAGTRGRFIGGQSGLAAIAVLAYARTGLTDPFEYRVVAEPGTRLDIHEYEFLMNALSHLTPAGVQVNTWDIRRQHVMLDPALGPAALPVRLNHAYRPYRRPRFAGVDSPTVP